MVPACLPDCCFNGLNMRVQVLKVGMRLLTGVLLIPFLINGLRPLKCADGEWLSTGWKCYTGGHIAFLLVSVASTIALLPILLIRTFAMARWSAPTTGVVESMWTRTCTSIPTNMSF